MKILYYFNGKVQKNFKYNELQISIIPQFILKFNCEFNLQRIFGSITFLNIFLFGFFKIEIYHTKYEDHAGLYFSLNILGLDIDYSYKDVRHYDYENNKWEDYEN